MATQKIGEFKFINQFYYYGVPNLPKLYEPYQQSWFRNFPQHYYRLWDDDSFTIFLKSMYKAWYPTYKFLPTPEQKTYFAQYLLLFHYGGIVPHLDMEYAYGDTSEILDKVGIVMFESGGSKVHHLVELEKFDVDFTLTKNQKKSMIWLSSRVLASVARHPYWLSVCSSIAKNVYYTKKDYFGLENLVSFTVGDNFLSIHYEKKKKAFKNIHIIESRFKTQASMHFKQLGWRVEEKLYLASKTFENGELGKFKATAEEIKERKEQFWKSKKNLGKFTMTDRQDFTTIHQQKIQYFIALSIGIIILTIFFVVFFQNPKSKRKINS